MSDTLRLSIERLAYGGDAIAHLDDGRTVFVAGACPGDIVDATMTASRKGYINATTTAVVEPSPDRIDTACPHAMTCGGCPWQHISYERQLEAKRACVVDALTRIAGFNAEEIQSLVAKTIPSQEEWGYRNKVEFDVSVREPYTLGTHARKGAFVAIESCKMAPKGWEEAPRAIQGALRFAAGSSDLGLERIGLRVSRRTGDVELALWTRTGAFPRAQVSRVLKSALEKFPSHEKGSLAITRVLLKGTTKERKVSGVEVLAGKGFWRERIEHETMCLSAPSFFQVNTAGAEKLIQLVLEGLSPTEDSSVLDLYCGAGTFTLPLARLCEDVTGIESYGSSVRDLRRNLENAGLDAMVIGGDVARELSVLEEANLAVVDPPRCGLDTTVTTALVSAHLQRLVYVSCDPTTLARDLKLLTQDAYRIERVTPVDLFPQTYHVETVVVMSQSGEGL